MIKTARPSQHRIRQLTNDPAKHDKLFLSPLDREPSGVISGTIGRSPTKGRPDPEWSDDLKVTENSVVYSGQKNGWDSKSLAIT